MIVVDASLMLEVLLRTPDVQVVEERLLDPDETLHAPHLLDVEIAHVLRRYAANGEIDGERGRAALDDLAVFPMRRYPRAVLLPRVWELRKTSPPMTPSMLLLPKRSEHHCSRAIAVSPALPAIAQPSSWSEDATCS
jgi:predicted nucleic acid-binding protein